jgi:2-polyprenyl-3-methyl-5-hydroxy-6-metoxy-1,4-benzoquinol methylase
LSIDYYDRKGAEFFARTANADLGATQARFLAYVPKGGSILEPGCGSGRDALAFARAGYTVTAFDGSAKMVELAIAHTGLPILHKRFQDVEWVGAFDGVWSCACLLHVPRSELRDVMARLARALKPGGAWFMSFKYGTTERFGHERHFTDMNEALLAGAIADVDLAVADLWISDDDRPERQGEKWTNAIARKR